MLNAAETAAVARRPVVLANALHHLAVLDAHTADDPQLRMNNLMNFALPAIAHQVASTVGPAEFCQACLEATDDDIAAAMSEHSENYGALLPWDGSIIKLILANLPVIIEAFKILIALLAKKS